VISTFSSESNPGDRHRPDEGSTMTKNRAPFLLLAIILVSLPAAAQSSTPPGSDTSPWGLRAGLGSDPDQIIVGANFLETPIANNLFLVPSAEIGLGDDHIILSATAPFHYRFVTSTNLRPYAGGGVTIGVDRHDKSNDNSDTNMEIALRATGGVIFRLRGGTEMFGELNLIFGDLNKIQAMVGWRF